MHARAAQNLAFAVDQKPVLTPTERTEAERNDRFVLAVCHAAGIELRRVRAPRGDIFSGQRKRASLAGSGGDHGFAVEQLDLDFAFAGRFDRDFDRRGVERQRFDLHAVDFDVIGRRDPQAHRSVDAGAGVPARIRLIGVIGAHLDFVFTRACKGLQIDVEIRVAVGTERGLFAVHIHLGFAVHALEFEQQRAGKLFFGQRKRLRVRIVAPLEPADVQPAHRLCRARFAQHRVVRDANRMRLLIRLQVLLVPTIVPIAASHVAFSLRFLYHQHTGAQTRLQDKLAL